MKMMVIPIIIDALGTIPKRTGGLENKRTSWEYPDYSIIKIGLTTEKSPGDWKRVAVT